jgi:tetratricopeptide (TPR) repeat protein
MKRIALILLPVWLAAIAWAVAPEDVIKQAQQFERDNQLAKAVESYESFLTQFADHSQVVEVHFRLAKAYDLLGKLEDMEKHLKAVADSDKKQFRNRAESFVLLAKHYATFKKYDEAAKLLEKLLSEGTSGLYEEEALNLCAGYYAVLKKYDDAAAKFNLLRLRRDSTYAESAAQKIAILWLNAGKLDLAINSISEFAQAYPNNANIPDLLLRAADAYREAKKFDTAASLCEQIQQRYPKSAEAQSGLVLIGLCQRDRKEYKEAVATFDKVAKLKELQSRGIAAEAMAQAAELCFTELNDQPGAIRRYEDAAKLARESESESKSKILELCYFRLGEYHFSQKNWAAARESYLQLRNMGSTLNVTPRIIACEQEMKLATTGPQTIGEGDVALMQEEIKKNAGSYRAAELEIFLLDRKVSDGLKRRAVVAPLAAEYEKLLTTYKADVLAQDNLELYIWWQIGSCRESSVDVPEIQKAVTAFEKVIALDADNKLGFKINALEHLALNAERAGDKAKAVLTYRQLFDMTKDKLDPKRADADPLLEKKAMGYLKSLISRSDSGNMMDDAIALTKKAIEDRGPASDTAREARLYLAELYQLKRDFSAAAKAFQEFLNVYGPRQNDEGDFLDGALKAAYPPDEKTAQLFDVSIRLAHCWYIQRHEQNLIKAYKWIEKNLPNGNKYMAEVQYALALELSKGKDAQAKENKRKYAEALWKNVVSPSTDFDNRDFNRTLQFWVRPGDEAFADQIPYVKNAILRAGQAWSEAGDHELAAGVYTKYLQLFSVDRGGKVGAVKRQGKNIKITAVDTEVEIARYALGREWISLGNMPKLVETYKPYVSGLRDSKYRISALMLLGHHAGKAGLKEPAIEAYATVLDEYGDNEVNAKDELVPVPAAQRIRQGSYNWDGFRIEPPAKLDLGDVRYALGFLYWKVEDFGQCAKTLAPFMTEPELVKVKSAERALYMLGQSYYKNFDFGNGYKVMLKLIDQFPKFEALEEVYVNAARGAVEAKAWNDVDRLCREYALKWPKSDRKQRMELYGALRTMFGKGMIDAAVSQIKGLAEGETFEDVKADAWYWLGRNELAFKPPRYLPALGYFDKSVTVFPRESACLEAAQCAVKLKQWDKAKLYLDRILGEFAKGQPAVVQEARTLMPEVMKEIAKAK